MVMTTSTQCPPINLSCLKVHKNETFVRIPFKRSSRTIDTKDVVDDKLMGIWIFLFLRTPPSEICGVIVLMLTFSLLQVHRPSPCFLDLLLLVLLLLLLLFRPPWDVAFSRLSPQPSKEWWDVTLFRSMNSGE